MKTIYIILFLLVASVSLNAQDFTTDLSSAKNSYGSGDLTNARFAMEKLLADLDIAIGKEILKLLPASLGPLVSDPKSDNVSGGSGAATGLFVHRTYAKDTKSGNVDIINNSPLITSVNAILNTPLIGGMMRNENQKVVRIQGYKSLLTKSDNGTATNYELQVALNNTLVTLRIENTTESEITQLAGNIPLAKIAQAAQ